MLQPQHALSRRRFLQQAAAAAPLALYPGALFATSSEALASTPSGKLRGEALDGVRIFRGVPFAEPPIGTLRFRPPVPIKPWQGIREATKFSAAAMQSGPATLARSEDCLYLNLWAPTGKGPFPVFVWIHGGGFTGGHAFAPIFDGSVFAREGVLVVTIPYRLGVFGFMDLAPLLGPTYADSGNNAMRDLTAALEWVHANITSFGGDPNRITVGGESAGAKALATLMAIPQARRLFQSAISESGGGERILTPPQALEVSRSYGTLWRIANRGSLQNFDDLRTADPEALLVTQTRLIATTPRHFPFRSEVSSAGLLTARPTDLIASASSHGKRLLIGTNRDESAAFIGPHPETDPTNADLGNLTLDQFNPVYANYKTLYPDMPADLRRIRAVTAEEYWVPSIRLADAHARTGGTTWMYRLDYTEPTGRMAHEAYHALDLSLVWRRLSEAEQADPTAAPLSTQIHQAWLNFIQGKPPTAPGLPAWPQYNATNRPTMLLAATSHIEQKPQDPELQLWQGIL